MEQPVCVCVCVCVWLEAITSQGLEFSVFILLFMGIWIGSIRREVGRSQGLCLHRNKQIEVRQTYVIVRRGFGSYDSSVRVV
jgi:hypothetical protein